GDQSRAYSGNCPDGWACQADAEDSADVSTWGGGDLRPPATQRIYQRATRLSGAFQKSGCFARRSAGSPGIGAGGGFGTGVLREGIWGCFSWQSPIAANRAATRIALADDPADAGPGGLLRDYRNPAGDGRAPPARGDPSVEPATRARVIT